MNRLILLGNGFDLAHKLPTAYSDFIKWYLKKSFGEAYEAGRYEDGLITIERRFLRDLRFGEKIAGVNGMIDYFFHGRLSELLNNKELRVEGYGNYFTNHFETRIHSPFFKNLIVRCSNFNWVDIENEYYDLLKSILVNNKDQLVVNRLNKVMEQVIRFLHTYLNQLQPAAVNQDYNKIFRERIYNTDVLSGNLVVDEYAKATMVLNFNYTNTIELYDSGGMILNYIHGKLGDESNPIVFGFGDELDDHYKKMELEKTKGIFQFIKSFWYFNTHNYHDLIRFIETEDFQVYIMGHSCGLSDRTMLNMIFEHHNCKSIKIFYHQWEGGNNFRQLTEEISRHFKNKSEMRRKIIPFPRSGAMPQLQAE